VPDMGGGKYPTKGFSRWVLKNWFDRRRRSGGNPGERTAFELKIKKGVLRT